MNDHLLPLQDLLEKYNVSFPSKSPHLIIHSEHLNNGRKKQSNKIYHDLDHSLAYVIFKGICDPVKILSLVSVSSLLVVYFLNREETERLKLFIFTVVIAIISTAIEIYGEAKINKFYRTKALSYNSRVVIDDHVHEIENSYILKGDIVLLRAGDIVPADSVLIKANNLEIDRSSLTGNRSSLIQSHTRRSEIFEESKNVVLSGDKVINGRGMALVVRIGKDNKIREILTKMVKSKNLESLIYSEVNIVFVGVFLASLVVTTILVLFGLITGITFVFALDLVFSVALAFIPECIPSTIKFMLFSAVSKLEKRGITVRDVGVVEKLGLVTIVCADKNAFVPPDNIFCSFVFNGNFLIDVELAFEDQDNDALRYLEGIGHITGLVSRNKSSRQRKHYHTSLEGLSKIVSNYFVGFNRMSEKIKDMKVHGLDGTLVDEIDFKSLYVTGPVESVLKSCNKIKLNGKVVKLTPVKRAKILKVCNETEKRFCNIIALAYNSFGKNQRKFRTNGFIFVCAYLIEEMTEIDAPLVTNILRSSGIGFAVISSVGHKSQLISSQSIVGLDPCYSESSVNSDSNLRIASKSNFDSYDLNMRSEFLNSENFIFFQAGSDDKKKIISDLKSLNHVVCYIGTSIDDCQAMNEADVAVCFSSSGIICKEACSVMIHVGKIDDLIYCIEEGRLFFANLRKAVRYITSHILPQFVPFFFYACLGTPIALSPILLIVLNYLFEMIPAIFFAYEAPENNLLVEDPINKDDISSLLPEDTETGNRSIYNKITNLFENLRRVVNHGLIYHANSLSWHILVIGIISSIGSMMAFFATLYDMNVPVSKMFFSANTYFSFGSPLLELSNGEVIDYEEQLNILYEGQSSFFISLVICQFASIVVCRRKKNYFFYQLFINFEVIFFSFMILCVTILLIYIEWFEKFLLLRRPILSVLMYPFGAAALILIVDTYKKYKLRNCK